MLTAAVPTPGSLREILVRSRIAAVAISVLLLYTIWYGLAAVWKPIFRVLNFFFEAVAILDIPYFSRQMTVLDRITLGETAFYLWTACCALLAAIFLSRWAYRVGPLQALTKEAAQVRGEHDA